MKQFEIEFKSHDIIEAENFEEARRKWVEKHHIPDEATCFYDCKTSEKKDVIGFCEMSELPIWEGDEFESDGEVMWLKSELGGESIHEKTDYEKDQDRFKVMEDE